MTQTTIPMSPGDDVHLTLLMAPQSLNLVTGQDREHLLAFGRAAFEAGKAIAEQGKCLHQIAEPAAAPFMYAIADGYGKAFFEEQGCVSSEAKDLQPEVDALNQNLDGEPPYRVVALYTHHEKSTPAQANHIADAGNMVSPTVLPEPALYVSGGQLENHCDPVDDSGRYIPARKTAAGPFSAALYTEQQVRAMLAAPPTRKQIEQYLYEQGCYVVPNGVPASAAMAKKKARAAQNWDPTFEEIRALAKKSGMSEYGAAQDKFLVVYRETLLACPADLKAFAVEVIAAVNPAEGVPAQDAEAKIGELLALARIMVRATLDADNKTQVQEIKAAIESEVAFERALRSALAATLPAAQTEAARSLLAERARQISTESYTPEQDDSYNPGVLALHGGLYACHAYDNLTKKRAPEGWQWDAKWWKSKDPRSNLVKAGALILAEIERMDRSFAAQAKQGGAQP